MAVAATILTAPWWALLLARHGIDPLLSAAQAGNHAWYSPLALLVFRFSEEPLFPLLAAIGLIGLFVCLLERRFLLPVWLLVIFVVDARKAPTDAMLALSMLIAIGMTSVVLPLAAHAGLAFGERVDGLRRDSQGRALGAQVLVCSLLMALAFLGIIAMPTGEGSALHALGSSQREAMSWVARDSQTGDRYLVITGWQEPWTDVTSEWFPALTGRESIATVQGHEWRGGKNYRERLEAFEDVQDCGQEDASCLDAWSAATGAAFDFIYLSKAPPPWAHALRIDDCCAALRADLVRSPDYLLVYDGPGASIFQKIHQTSHFGGPT
jgi:hypothetical protein